MKRWTRKGSEEPEVQEPTCVDPTHTVMPSQETQRALAARRAADREYVEARRLRDKIDRKADVIDAETSKNGFRVLIANALRSGT